MKFRRNTLSVVYECIAHIRIMFPELRVGQIVSNAHSFMREKCGDPYYLKDNLYADMWEQYVVHVSGYFPGYKMDK